jgi:hypothetical protein
VGALPVEGAIACALGIERFYRVKLKRLAHPHPIDDLLCLACRGEYRPLVVA